jgi:xylulokinase
MAASGSLLNWIVRNWAGEEAAKASTLGLSPHQHLDRLATSVPHDNELLFLPYMLGEKTPLMDPFARGTLVGLGLHHGIAHVWRAALEGVVFGFRHHVEVFGERGLREPCSPPTAAQPATLATIAADVLDRPVTRIDRHPAPPQRRLRRRHGRGRASGLSISALCAPGRSFTPDPRHADYDRKYRQWREVYQRLKTLIRNCP